MEYMKTDLPDHFKLDIKITLLQYAHTGNVRQKGAGFEWFRETLRLLCNFVANLTSSSAAREDFFRGGSGA